MQLTNIDRLPSFWQIFTYIFHCKSTFMRILLKWALRQICQNIYYLLTVYSFLTFHLKDWQIFVSLRFSKQIRGHRPYKVYSLYVQPKKLFLVQFHHIALLYIFTLYLHPQTLIVNNFKWVTYSHTHTHERIYFLNINNSILQTCWRILLILCNFFKCLFGCSLLF